MRRYLALLTLQKEHFKLHIRAARRPEASHQEEFPSDEGCSCHTLGHLQECSGVTFSSGSYQLASLDLGLSPRSS